MNSWRVGDSPGFTSPGPGRKGVVGEVLASVDCNRDRSASVMLLRTQAPVDPEPDRKVVLADSTKDALRSWRVDLAAVTIDCCSVLSWPSMAATPGPEDTLYLAGGGGEGHRRGAARRRRIEADLKKVVLPRAG